MKQITATIIVLALIFLCGCAKNSSQNDVTTTSVRRTETTNEVSTTATATKPFYTKEIKTDLSDAYSFVVKEKCDEIKEAWDTRSEDSSFDRNETFDEFTRRFPDVYYFLYDLNGDGIKELLFGGYMKIGYDIEAHNPPVKICITDVYTIKNGKAENIDSQSKLSEYFIRDRYLLSNGMIVTKLGFFEDSPDYYFLAYEKDQLDFKCYVYHSVEGSGDSYSKVVDFNKLYQPQAITKTEYESIYNDLCGNAKPVEIDWKRIDEYGT